MQITTKNILFWLTILGAVAVLASCNTSTPKTVTQDSGWYFVANNDNYEIMKLRRNDTTYSAWVVDFQRPVLDSTGRQATDSLHRKIFYNSWQPIDGKLVGEKLK
jgi:hypothetical protein